MAQRLNQRDALLVLLTQERNRLAALRHRPTVIANVQERAETLIAWYVHEIETLTTEIRSLLNSESVWQEAAQRLQSVVGIDVITVAWLLVETLAFRDCATPQQAAASVGLAPRPFESGTSVRKRVRIGHGGATARADGVV